MSEEYRPDFPEPVFPTGDTSAVPHHRLEPVHASGSRRRRRERRGPRDEARLHFAELAAAAERAHRRMVESHSPYRFCIFRRGDDVLVDVVLLGTDGGISRLVRRNITHETFFDAAARIESGEGLLFENRG